MPGLETRAAAPRAAGLLTLDRGRALPPWSWLVRLLPVKIESFFVWVQEYHRLLGVLRRIKLYFPEAMAEYQALNTSPWYQVLHHLSSLVEEAGWFPVNWPALNEAWAIRMHHADEDDPGDQLARYLHYLPLALYGFTTDTLREYPPMELLHLLLAKEVEAVSERTLAEAELYDTVETWSEPDREATWALLRAIEVDPGRYPEPVRYLPALGRWACGATGNVFLDRHFDPYDRGPWLTWEHDLEPVKLAWQRAKPTVDMFHRLLAWYEQDAGRLTTLANFIIAGGSTDELDW